MGANGTGAEDAPLGVTCRSSTAPRGVVAPGVGVAALGVATMTSASGARTNCKKPTGPPEGNIAFEPMGAGSAAPGAAPWKAQAGSREPGGLAPKSCCRGGTASGSAASATGSAGPEAGRIGTAEAGRGVLSPALKFALPVPAALVRRTMPVEPERPKGALGACVSCDVK